MKKQPFISIAIGCSMAFTAASPIPAPRENQTSRDLQHLKQLKKTDRIDRAIQNGLEFLARRQVADQGYFRGKYRNAYTALACLALMAAGEQDGRSEYGTQLRRGIIYLVEQTKEKGPYLGTDGSRMYGHAIATVALCEAYGMLANHADNQAIKNAIQRLTPVIIDAQVDANTQHQGGWRYEPDGADADLSVTAWQILALRALENCGFEVPQKTIDAALKYVRSLYTDGQGFSYMKGRQPTPAMLAAGIVSVTALADDTDPINSEMIQTTAAQLLKITDATTGKHYYYQAYYLAIAANMLGDDYGKSLVPRIQKALLKLQQDNGEFAQVTGYDGGVYSTSLAILSLAVRYQWLPIYQK